MNSRHAVIGLLSIGLLSSSFLVFGDPVKTLSAELVIDVSEGGSESLRLQKKLTRYLADRNCPLQARVDSSFVSKDESEDGSKGESADKANKKPIAAVFLPLQRPLKLAGSTAKSDPDLTIKTLSSVNYSPAVVLVRSVTGVDNLSSLAHESLSAVTQQSISGYQDQMAMLTAAGVQQPNERLVFAGNHIGALSLLMHKDVFAAAVDFSVAERWAKSNGLQVIASGKKRTTGGVYFNKNATPDVKANCSKALLALSRDKQPGKSLLKLFPDWLKKLTLAPLE